MKEYLQDQVGYFKETPDGFKARPIEFNHDSTVILSEGLILERTANKKRVEAADGRVYMPVGTVPKPALKPLGSSPRTKRVIVSENSRTH